MHRVVDARGAVLAVSNSTHFLAPRRLERSRRACALCFYEVRLLPRHRCLENISHRRSVTQRDTNTGRYASSSTSVLELFAASRSNFQQGARIEGTSPHDHAEPLRFVLRVHPVSPAQRIARSQTHEASQNSAYRRRTHRRHSNACPSNTPLPTTARCRLYGSRRHADPVD